MRLELHGRSFRHAHGLAEREDRVVLREAAVECLEIFELDPGAVVLRPVGNALVTVIFGELVDPALANVRDVPTSKAHCESSTKLSLATRQRAGELKSTRSYQHRPSGQGGRTPSQLRCEHRTEVCARTATPHQRQAPPQAIKIAVCTVMTAKFRHTTERG